MFRYNLFFCTSFGPSLGSSFGSFSLLLSPRSDVSTAHVDTLLVSLPFHLSIFFWLLLDSSFGTLLLVCTIFSYCFLILSHPCSLISAADADSVHPLFLPVYSSPLPVLFLGFFIPLSNTQLLSKNHT